ncbi:MAG: DNA polymerase I [Janthinobacterium lividum]
MTSSLQHLYLIDGSGFIFRAFHALPPLTRADGTPVNAVLGFVHMLMRLLENTDVDHLAVVFDSGRRNFRHDIYPDYKAHRPPAPEELIPQFPLIREACQAFNVATVEAQGFEADDLIASYAACATQQGARVTVVSSDKDLMQLINDQVDMMDPMKNKIIGVPEVQEKFGVGPDRVIDVQALAGDSSDNVPGVPGIGPKTAAQLITEFDTLENLLNNLDRIPQAKRRETLEAHQDKARISYQLVHLSRNVSLPLPLEAFKRKAPEREILNQFLTDQSFQSLLSKIGRLKTLDSFSSAVAAPLPKAAKVKGTYHLVQTAEDLKKWIDEAHVAGIVAFDCETNSLDPLKADLVGFSLSSKVGQACYVPLAHKAAPALTLFDDPTDDSTVGLQIPFQEALDLIKPLLCDPSVLKVGHNLKYDALVLDKYDLNIFPLDDTIVMSYSLDGSQHGHSMDDLAKLHLNHETIKYKDITGVGRKQITFDYVDLPQACAYAAEDAEVTLELYQLFKARLTPEQTTVIYETLDRPMISVLKDMESTGITVDVQALRTLSQDFTQRLSELEKDIHRLAGHPFNIGSPKQLGDVIYLELGLEGGKKNKSGAFATGADILEELAAKGHEFPEKVLAWRQLAKLKSTYTDALMEQINPKTGRVHTTYALTITSTGRLASSNPNLQNIPIRSEEGRKIRAAFVAKEGYKLLSLDYSQIELRLMAHMAKVPALLDAFKAGLDIHTATAAQVFNLPLEAVDSEHRRRAKTINFGIIYGMSAFGLARQLKVPTGEASFFIKAYHERYPGIQAFMDQQKLMAHEKGYVKTLFGRKCYVPTINDRNPILRNAAERQAINAPFQGTAADILKKAMIILHDALNAGGYQSKMLLQVHDELIIECPDQELAEVQALATKIMSQAAYLDVSLLVDAGIGQSWAEADE